MKLMASKLSREITSAARSTLMCLFVRPPGTTPWYREALMDVGKVLLVDDSFGGLYVMDFMMDYGSVDFGDDGF